MDADETSPRNGITTKKSFGERHRPRAEARRTQREEKAKPRITLMARISSSAHRDQGKGRERRKTREDEEEKRWSADFADDAD